MQALVQDQAFPLLVLLRPFILDSLKGCLHPLVYKNLQEIRFL